LPYIVGLRGLGTITYLLPACNLTRIEISWSTFGVAFSIGSGLPYSASLLIPSGSSKRKSIADTMRSLKGYFEYLPSGVHSRPSYCCSEQNISVSFVHIIINWGFVANLFLASTVFSIGRPPVQVSSHLVTNRTADQSSGKSFTMKRRLYTSLKLAKLIKKVPSFAPSSNYSSISSSSI
jgi:hypothetical protein